MKKIISITQNEFNLSEIVNEIPSDYFVVFFAPVEKIDIITKNMSDKYQNVIGSSNYKNIHKNGCDYNSISIIGVKVKKCKTILIKEINKSPIRYYKEIQKLKEIYEKGHSILISFTDGISMSEENVLTIINNELKDIPLIGGSAGDKGNFTETKVSVGNECMSNSTALAMITTDMFIDNFYENIYTLSDITGIVTEVDLFNRKIKKINNKPALNFYTESLHVNKSNVTHEFVDHPFAQVIGDTHFISSMKGVNSDDSIDMYCRLFPNSYVNICNPVDYISLWNEKVKKNNYKYIGGIFINCIFRTSLFEKENTMNQFVKYLRNYGEFICMTSYGEQFNRNHVNQTLTCCLFRER